MLIFELLMVMMIGAVALTGLARWWRLPYPSLLAIFGCVLVFLPGIPHFVLQPELALTLFVAPVLVDAVSKTSLRDLHAYRWPIAGLVVMAVVATTTAVAVVVHIFVPTLPWAAAIALGAIVAPPDAAAATAVLRDAPMPHRLRQILEGESLLNDASALLIYRVAVSAAMGAGTGVLETAPTLLLVVAGSIAVGVCVGWAWLHLVRRVDNVPSAIVLQFVGSFGLWMVAERIGLSGILTVVAYAIYLAQSAPMSLPASIRLPSHAVWETVVFILNALAFVLVGLQLGPILERLSPSVRIDYALVAFAVLGTVISARVVWIAFAYLSSHLIDKNRGRLSSQRLLPPTVKGGIVISWCGMRGIVTLATALALPDGANSFPGRDLILVTAFVVVLGTLVFQGLTLRPLLLWFNLNDDPTVERETEIARAFAVRAAIDSLDGDHSAAADALRREYAQLTSSAEGGGPTALPRLRRKSIEAARREIARLRHDRIIGDDAYRLVEAQLDRAEAYADGGPM